MGTNPGTVFNLREIRESLALAEQLAKASMSKTRSADANNNEEIPRGPTYVPPKQLLLYLVRMGSFTSAPKILNEDSQDDDVDFQSVKTSEEMKDLCRQELRELPPILKRSFLKINSVQENPSIRVLQWNVLSQALGEHNDNFVSCPPEALSWQTRRYRILEEILEYNPDILCLQEVDHYNFLEKALRSQGYSGIYFSKPDSPCIYIKGNNGPDGCAIFYKNHIFEQIRVETRIIEVWRVQSNQVAILAILRHKPTGKEVVVVTTHLKARQGALLSTLRNEQGKDLLDFLETHVGERPVIICGDFNAEPCEPVYTTMLSDPRFPLDSAYRSAGSEPAYTTWKVRGEGEVCHTIDYIFYSQRQLTVQQLLQFPSDENIGPGRVPSFQYPSDHFSLVADFQINADASSALIPAFNKLFCV